MRKKFIFLSLVPLLLTGCTSTLMHTVVFNSNGGSEVLPQEVEHGSKINKPDDPTRLGYNFVNWTYQNEEWSFIGYSVTQDMTLDANWSIITYNIVYELDGGTVSSPNPTTYTVEDNFTLNEPTRTGYTFTGWYDSENNKVTSISSGDTGDLVLTANWSADLHTLSVTSEDTSKGTVAITSGSGYSGESITVVASPIDDCVFKGWYHEDAKVSDDTTYTFTMPTSDYSLVAHFLTKKEEEEIRYAAKPIISEDGKTITYGLYPQKNVNDSTLVSALNALTTLESNGWYLYNNEYYAKVSATPCSSNQTFDNGTIIVRETTYWFKCEPITWNVLSNNNGEYYILSSVLLDAHCYYNSKSNRTIDGKTIYPNNYEYSNIRTWLNNDFYNSAFALGNTHIQTTTVDNSASTTISSNNPCACNNTQDKVFLPSYQDYTNRDYGFITSFCKTTDWARARGAFYSTYSSYYLYNGYYWTRSPNSDPNETIGVCYNGFYSVSVISTSYSVRPSLSIKIL